MAEINAHEWDTFLANHPDHHLLQTSSWGQLKTDFGWQAARIAVDDCGAQLLIKPILAGLSFAYLAKGPVGTGWQHLWPEIDAICQRKRCVFMKIEPDVWMQGNQKFELTQEHIPTSCTPSSYSIQPMRTLIIDIRGEEAQILGQMKQKTRYNINLAQKKSVIVKPYRDVGVFYRLMEITGERDRFGVHNLAYYQRAYDLFSARDQCQLLLAEYEGTPIAALIAFMNGRRAWYFYGASSGLHRDKMPNYLVQWEAIRWAKSQGCAEYNLWGVPDEDIDTLEAHFTNRSNGLWGVYRFKRGFGGELKRSVGPWDQVYHPRLYRLYSMWSKYRKVES